MVNQLFPYHPNAESKHRAQFRYPGTEREKNLREEGMANIGEEITTSVEDGEGPFTM